MSPFLEALLAILSELLKNCPEPEEQKLSFLKKPKPIQEVRLWIKARASGMSGRDFRAARAELEALRADATDDDLKEFIAQSQAA